MNAIPFDGQAIAPETAAFLTGNGRLLVNGQWVDGTGQMTSIDPATGLPLMDFAIGGAAEIDAAVAAARAAFDGPWRRMTVAERMAAMTKVARLMEERATLLT